MDHERIAARIEHLSMATGIVAGLSAAAAAAVQPTGLSAFGVWLGLVDEPLIVTLAPIFGWLATAAGTLSGSAYFLAQWQKRRFRKQAAAKSATTDLSAVPAKDDT
ncbi:hypothetical protein ACH518_02550 [Methylomonas sp. HW2-6]|uniref:hypothetical protein n=1 Tax=Methylomonas sp. HW2-6 TaxID=3376687 RepID=UPI004042046B